jgi:hypothetical protein
MINVLQSLLRVIQNEQSFGSLKIGFSELVIQVDHYCKIILRLFVVAERPRLIINYPFPIPR